MKNRLIKILVSLCKSSASSEDREKRFLILSTTGLGDTLWGTPAIRALRESFPTSYIGVLTSPLGGALLQHNRRIDELFILKTPLLPSLFSLYRKLKEKKITHVLSFHTSQRFVLPLAALLGPQVIVGTSGMNKGLDSLLSHPLEKTPIHETERRLKIVEAVGAQTLDPSLELFLSLEEERLAEQFLQSLEIPSYLPLIVLHPGAKDGFKCWPPSHFVELGSRLSQNLGCRFLITGTPAEKDLVESIAARIPGATAVTHLPLLVTAALIKKVDLMITNDTGPMHLGFAMKVPTLGLFVPTDPALCGPYFTEKAQVIAKRPTCNPCIKKKCKEPFCLLQIGVQEVYNEALKFLEKADVFTPS